MSLKFGTSGLRGLVTEMTPETVRRYTQAFLAACETGGVLCVGRDLRPSSPRIAEDVIAAARQAGFRVVDCGEVPTPALALEAQACGAGALMVTGSHIPADRNGLKFYTRTGEITKPDEVAILSAMDTSIPDTSTPDGPRGALVTETEANARFIRRYTTAFGPAALRGRRIGVYSHSAVGRDVLMRILKELGADVIQVGRSDHFIPVDTEAVDADTRARIADWVKEHRLDALVSTDGDSDRPLLADETGCVVPGDILGQITAQSLGAQVVVTPVSSNSGVTQKAFRAVIRTGIGSPFVIAGMQKAGGDVAGYEANGGFLLGFEAQGPAGPIAPLMTRDCMLPLVVTLCAAGSESGSGPVSARVAEEPEVTTLSDRLQDIPRDKSDALIAEWTADPAARAAFLAPLGRTEAALDLTDGLRMMLEGGGVLHVRPSGNAPELRLYVEENRPEAAQDLMRQGLAALRAAVLRA